MPTDHTVVQGETMLSIAKLYEYRDWETIWNDPANDELRKTRENAGVLAPDDVVKIPDKTPKTVPCDAGGKVAFTAKAVRAYLSQTLKDAYGEPFKQTKYKVVVDDDLVLEGTTDGDGNLLESVPPHAKTALITVYVTIRGSAGRSRTAEVNYPKLLLGGVDPLDTATGVQGRLIALGYDCPLDGELTGEQTRSAVKAFQDDNTLDVTGDVDTGTRNKLDQVYKGI